MILSLFRRTPARQPAAALSYEMPTGICAYAIGDVHGRVDLLRQLFDQIDADIARRNPEDARIILLGDLVDRGPDSCGVVELCMTRDWGRAEPSFIAGNHEEMLLTALSGNMEAVRFWLRNGGAETMLSYGVSADLLARGTADQLANEFAERVPQSHLRFLGAMLDHVEIGEYWFVHAGIQPGLALEDQKPSDLRWIRSGFLDSAASHGGMVIHGHTITETVDERSNRIGIDTGAYASGKLTAIGISGDERWYLST